MALKDLTQAQREFALSVYPGQSSATIAKQLGVSYHSIRLLLHEQGIIATHIVKKQRVVPTEQQREAIIADYRSGISTKELARRNSLHHGTICRTLRLAGINIVRKHLSEAQKQYIVDQYISGKSTYKIAEEIGFTDVTVSNVLRGCSVPIRDQKKTDAQSEQYIVECYKAGESSESLAKRLGIGPTLILGVLDKHQVERRGRIKYERSPEIKFEPKFDPLQLPNYRHPGIYKFTNLINGKVYVGQAKDIYHRYYRHSERRVKGLFSSALKKYGIGNFDFEVVERVDDLSKLNEREQYWMDYYQSYDLTKGYNLKRIAFAARGYKHSPQRIEQQRQVMKAKGFIGQLSPNWGRKHSPETRAKMSAAAKARSR